MAEQRRMPVSSARRKANRRKRLIRIWTRRIWFILVVALLCTGIVLLAKKLLQKVKVWNYTDTLETKIQMYFQYL